MKILYDSQIFWQQGFGGVSRYFNKLCLYNGGRFEYTVSGKYSDNIYASHLSDMKPFPIKRKFKGKWNLMRAFDDQADRAMINNGKYDIYHPTYHLVPKYPRDKPMVITAHDFIHELFPQYFLGDRTSIFKRKSLERATRVVAISKTTKDDLLTLYPDIVGDKVDIVYHAIEWQPRIKKQGIVSKPYILFTGQRGLYKNFLPFIKAVAPVLHANDLNLVCSGSEFSSQEKSFIESLNIASRVFHTFADEDGLRTLYENALCFVFPSLYEGFGLPILEAFISGCPAVLSGTSCFPEIAADGAEYFDPYSDTDMRNKIERVVQSEALRNALAEKGRKRFDFFTMEKMMEGTSECYRRTINTFRK